VRDEVVHGLWRDESSLIAQPVAASSSDAVLRELAASLAPDALIADLASQPWGVVSRGESSGREPLSKDSANTASGP
jgi:hypothetical protein